MHDDRRTACRAACRLGPAGDATGLKCGADEQAQPPQLANELENLQESGVKIYVVKVTLLETGTARKTCNP